MSKLILVLLSCVLTCCSISRRITKITVYHRAFLKDDPYGSSNYNDDLKKIPGCKKYISRARNLRVDMQKHLTYLDSAKSYVSLTAAQEPHLLAEIRFMNGQTKKIYSWIDGTILYNKKEFKKDTVFIFLIESHFLKVSWTNLEKDLKYN